jgi:cell division protein FtsZ
MSNAGSALMGIGRASGDNRASQAAQQAIESPLIEVSIDGAKGVLFNVTGGYDMSMSEIQEAAEIITSAVSPDANIIFGATLKPEIEDELIITVIATGFDSAYFQETEAAQQEADNAHLNDRMAEEVVGDVDMNLDHTEAAAIFNEETQENMWSQPAETPDEDESDTPAFLRRRKKRNKKTEE